MFSLKLRELITSLPLDMKQQARAGGLSKLGA